MMNLAPTPDLPTHPQQATFEPEDAVLAQLADIAIAAALNGAVEAAAPIFDALALFEPENPLIAIGRALGAMSDGRPEDAIRVLTNAGANGESASDEQRAILLLALCLARHQTDAARLCQHLLDGARGHSLKIAQQLKPAIDRGL